jgi:hypothetical protein
LCVQARDFEVFQPNFFGAHQILLAQTLYFIKCFEILNNFGQRPKKIATAKKLKARNKPKTVESQENSPLS